MRKLPFIQTSVFIDDRYSFTGNQLATFYDASSNNITKEEMQGIALEMNFSETTFIFPSVKDCDAKVRIFTPRSELDFAGHPTLGTAFVLREKGIIPHQTQKGTLELGIGPIDIEFFNNNEVGMIQPEPEFLEKYTDKDKMAKILGINKDGLSNEFPMQVVSTGFPFLIVPVKSMDIINSISLNPQLQLEILNSFTTS
ncbi:MAG: PhzF family phenazine biosynthesis protein, partial [Candidatus Heimdallarchaeota archaeon]